MKKNKIAAAILLGTAMLITAGIAVFINYDKIKEVTVVNLKKDFKTYKNPIRIEDEWEDYGVGDPYVLRYNGRYYLYCSTKDWRVGIKAWSSEDLVNWKYEGLVTEDTKTTGAYAPEVVYWNGAFYMYTSPAGQGHYVLKSDSPTGPFVVMTDNLGLSIDGSVFIDDDGKWYFTHAGDKGILGNQMPDPYTMKFERNTGAYLLGWTEGSMIIKRNGLYYMTYTGNHVFSKGYRINYSVSKTSPISGYKTLDNNPIIISTKADFNGLGHSSTVLGPDMDSYYIIYHNLIGSSKEGPPLRYMNIDRLVFNGSKLSVLGPTNSEQQVPKRADYYLWLKDSSEDKYENKTIDNNKLVILNEKTGSNYTAEFNFRIDKNDGIIERSTIGAVFSYEDDKNFMFASVDILKKTLSINSVKDGKAGLIDKIALPQEFDFTKLHSIKVEKDEHKLKVYFDNMLKKESVIEGLAGDRIGYIYNEVDPVFEYTAFNNDVDGSSDFEAYKPVPGKIEAVQFMKDEERGFHSENKGNVSNEYREDASLDIKKTEDGSYSVNIHKNEWTNYNIKVEENGSYGVDMLVKNVEDKAALELYIDGKKTDDYSIKPLEDNKEQWHKTYLGNIELEEGVHTLTIKQIKGETEIKNLELYKVNNEKIEISYDFEEGRPKNWMLYGGWSFKKDGLTISATNNPKGFTGDTEWTNYELETDITINKDSNTIDGGLMFRVTNESYFDSQVQDSFTGYYLGLDSMGVSLSKVNYNKKLLKYSKVDLEPGKTYHIKVKVENNTFTVYVEDMKKPVLTYVDSNMYSYGKIGIYQNKKGITFKNIKVSNKE